MKPARWWYHPPTAYDLRCLPKIWFYRRGDEFCNPTFYMRFPLMGSLTIRTSRRIRIDNKCDHCITEYGPYCPGCMDCHRGPRCHNWLECTDEIHTELALRRCPACGGNYCADCEEYPAETCPYRGEKTREEGVGL